MVLKAILAALDGLPEAQQGLYRPGTREEGLEGRFVLDVEGSEGFALENVRGLKSAVSAERTAREKAEHALKGFGELTPESVQKSLEKLAELEKLDPAKEADKLAEARARSMIEQVTAKHAVETGALAAQLDKAKASVRAMTLESAIDAALAKADVLNPEAVRLKLKSHLRLQETGDVERPYAVSVVGADGNPLIDSNANNIGLDGFLAGLRKDDVWAVNFRAQAKAGAGAPGSGASAGGKRMSRTAFAQLSPQARADAAASGVVITD